MKKLMIAAAAAAMIGGAEAGAVPGLFDYSDAAYTVTLKVKDQGVKTTEKKLSKTITIDKAAFKYIGGPAEVYAQLYTEMTNMIAELKMDVTKTNFYTVSYKPEDSEKALTYTNKVAFSGKGNEYKDYACSWTEKYLIVKKGESVVAADLWTLYNPEAKKYQNYFSTNVIATIAIQDFSRTVPGMEKSRKLAASCTLNGYVGAGAGTWKLVKETKTTPECQYVSSLSGNVVEQGGIGYYGYGYGTFNLAFNSKYTKLLGDKTADEVVQTWAKDNKAVLWSAN